MFIRILRDTRLGGKRVEAGREMEVSIQDARALVAAGKAEVLVKSQRAPEPPKDEAEAPEPKKRGKKGK